MTSPAERERIEPRQSTEGRRGGDGRAGRPLPGQTRRPVGVTIPGVVRSGVVPRPPTSTRAGSAPTPTPCSPHLGRDVHVVNDADAAGSPRPGTEPPRAGKGLVILTTLGTGIGSALLYDGVLVPNSELGHLEIEGTLPRAGRQPAQERGAHLGAVGRAADDLLPDAGEALLPRPVRRRRRRQQGRREFLRPHRDRHRDHPRDAAKPCRHHRRRGPGGRQAEDA